MYIYSGLFQNVLILVINAYSGVTSPKHYKEELQDGFYLNTLELPVLHQCYHF